MIIVIIVIVILLILALLIVPFARQIIIDKAELRQTPINKKFETLVSIINESMLGGMGDITLFDDDPRLMNLMSEDMRNMLIQFYYSTGNLTITLNYKYFQKELVHEELYSNLRNITIFMQKDIANSFIEVCNKMIREHQQKVGLEDVNAISPRKGVTTSIDADPTQALSAAYVDLSLKQKRSLVNFLCVIAKQKYTSDTELLKLTPISQMLLTLHLSFDDCKAQLEREGEQSMCNDLKALGESRIALLILSVMQLLEELSYPSQHIDPKLEPYTFELFGKIGYSQEDIEGILQKMVLMQQMYNP